MAIRLILSGFKASGMRVWFNGCFCIQSFSRRALKRLKKFFFLIVLPGFFIGMFLMKTCCWNSLNVDLTCLVSCGWILKSWKRSCWIRFLLTGFWQEWIYLVLFLKLSSPELGKSQGVQFGTESGGYYCRNPQYMMGLALVPAN